MKQALLSLRQRALDPFPMGMKLIQVAVQGLIVQSRKSLRPQCRPATVLRIQSGMACSDSGAISRFRVMAWLS